MSYDKRDRSGRYAKQRLPRDQRHHTDAHTNLRTLPPWMTTVEQIAQALWVPFDMALRIFIRRKYVPEPYTVLPSNTVPPPNTRVYLNTAEQRCQVRGWLLRRDGYYYVDHVLMTTCRLCGERLKAHEATIDHWQARSTGRPSQVNLLSNLVLAHYHCNEHKGDSDWGTIHV